MTRSNPARVLNGVRPGHICDRCNKRVWTGDLVRACVAHYDRDGWVLRRVWCDECGETALGEGTDRTDEVIVEAWFWDHRLVSVKKRDRSLP
jgi:hypothetical protein